MPPSDFVSRGQALVAAGQYQEAVKVCRLGLLGAPTQLDGRLVLAQALLALRRYDEVLAEMRVALELDTRMAAAHALKGEALLRKGDVHAAREVLLRAKSLAPGDPSVAALVAETELAISSGGSKLPIAGDAQTKHYPTHRGASPAPAAARPAAGAPAGKPRPDVSSSSFTRPEGPNLRSSSFTKPDAVRAAFEPPERTGTVELDPEESGIELVDDDLGDVIDPPRADDSDVLEVDDLDVVEESRSQALPAPRPTDREATRAGRPGGGRGSQPPATAPARPSGVKRAASGPDLGRLFPDEEGTGGLDLLLGELSGPPGASAAAAAKGAAIPLRAPPTGSTPLVDPPQPARPWDRPPGKPGDDMRTIRAGLGLDPELKLPPPVSSGAHRQRGDDSTGIVVEAARPRARGDDSSLLVEAVPQPLTEDQKRRERTRKVATDPGGRTLAPLRRSRLKMAIWSVLALAVIAGGVWVGFFIRGLILDGDVADERTRARLAILGGKDPARLGDSWTGWRSARDIHEGIVNVQGSAANRAALARIRGVLAADFGDDLEGARAAVEALGDNHLFDAEVARAYVALIDGDDVALEAAAAAIAAVEPDASEASYFAGRAALLAERWDDAILAFDKARAGDTRAASLIGLAQAHAGKRAWPEARAAIDLALAQHPTHEAVVVARARIVAAGLEEWTAEAPAVQGALEQVLADSERPIVEQARGVSPWQAAWAALALAEIEVRRGDPAAARRALGRARAGAIPDRGFTVAVIHALLAVGDLPTARQEAEHAIKTWAGAVAVHLAAAEVALAEGEPKRVLTALEAAGDLSARPEALALRGQAHLALGEIEAATDDLDRAIKLLPDLEGALVARAEIDLADGKPRAAIDRLEKRYTAGASSALAVTYAAALRGVGDRDRARTVLAELTGASAPAATAGRAWLETARLERDGGDARAARAAYTKAIELLPDATGARLEAALLAVDVGDAAGAKESLDRLVAEAAHDGRVLVESARVHVLVGDLDGAKALLDRADAEATAPRWQIARERGRVALRLRSFPVAIEALISAASLEPQDAETRLLLIDAHLGAQDGPAASRVLADVIKGFAGLPVLQLAAGRVALYKDAFGDAREAFVKAKDQLERERGTPRWIAEATYWLGLTTYYDGDPVRGRALLAQATTVDPTMADGFMQLGLIDSEKLQWKRAIESYLKVTKLDPGNHEAWFYLGEAYLNARPVTAKQKKLAKKALETYRTRAPTGDLIPEVARLLKTL